MTVHSAIAKVWGENTYQPYISDEWTHDQASVKITLINMIASTILPDTSTIVIENGNCCFQYKSANHFSDLQCISDKYNKVIIHLYSVASHGKGEVRWVAKVAVRQEIAIGELFSTARKVNKFWNNKFSKNMQPKYCIKEICPEQLEEERRQNHKKLFKIINASAPIPSFGFSFQFSRFWSINQVAPI